MRKATTCAPLTAEFPPNPLVNPRTFGDVRIGPGGRELIREREKEVERREGNS